MTPDHRKLDYGERGTVLVVPDGEALALAAAQTLISAAESAAARGRRALVALSGGSTPKRMGEVLSAPGHAERVRWDHLDIFWGDERWVPLDSSESNAGEALRGFLDAAPIADDHVHPYDTLNADPEAAAAAYVDTIRDAMRANHTPQFDLVFLGMGDDGHTASLFPGTAAIHERERFVVSHRVEKLDATRLTFTPPLINAATTVVFLVGGAGKAATLAQVLDGPVDVNALPSQVIRPVSGDLEWIVDEAAAARLRRNDTHG